MRDFINRAVIVILILTMAALCTVTLAVPVRTLDAWAGQLTALADFIRQFTSLSPQWFLRVGICVFLALVVDFVAVLLLILELRHPRVRFIRAVKTTGGEVEVSIVSIADRLRYEINALPGVLHTKPKVVGKRKKGVEVKLDVDIGAGLDVPVQAEQIVETARQVVEERMGLRLARAPKVHVRAVPYPKLVESSGKPEPPPEPEPAPTPEPPPPPPLPEPEEELPALDAPVEEEV